MLQTTLLLAAGLLQSAFALGTIAATSGTFTTSSKILSVCLSHSGQFVAAGETNGRISIWNVGTGRLEKTFKGHSEDVSGLEFSPSDEHLVSSSYDGNIKIWSLPSGTLLRTLSGDSGRVNSIGFSKNGEYLVSGGEDATLHIWRFSTSEKIRNIAGHSGAILSVSFSPIGDLVASTGEDAEIRLSKTSDGTLIHKMRAGLINIQSAVAFSPSGQFLASGGQDSAIRYWRTVDGALTRTFSGSGGPIQALAFSPSGEFLISAGQDNELRIWRVSDGEPVGIFKGHHGIITGVSVSSEGGLIASGGFDRTLRLWPLPKTETVTEAPSSSGPNKKLPSADVDVNVPDGRENPAAIAVIAGVRDYTNRDVPTVDYALNDAATMRKYLIKSLGFKPENIIFLSNPSKGNFERVFGTRENFDGELNSYVEQGKSDVFVYYAGHGAPDIGSRGAYFVLSDTNPDFVKLNGYPLALFYQNLSKIKARSVTVVIDACFSGGSNNGSLIHNASPLIEQTKDADIPKNLDVLTSASGSELASWYPDKSHSLYTYFFLKALQGHAKRDNTKSLTLKEIKEYLDQNVPRFAKRLYSRSQTPQLHGNDSRILVEYQ